MFLVSTYEVLNSYQQKWIDDCVFLCITFCHFSGNSVRYHWKTSVVTGRKINICIPPMNFFPLERGSAGTKTDDGLTGWASSYIADALKYHIRVFFILAGIIAEMYVMSNCHDKRRHLFLFIDSGRFFSMTCCNIIRCWQCSSFWQTAATYNFTKRIA